MELMFIGADHEVTGSCHYLRVGDKNILVDYGMEQGANVFENCELPVEEALIDYVFILLPVYPVMRVYLQVFHNNLIRHHGLLSR